MVLSLFPFSSLLLFLPHFLSIPLLPSILAFPPLTYISCPPSFLVYLYLLSPSTSHLNSLHSWTPSFSTTDSLHPHILSSFLSSSVLSSTPCFPLPHLLVMLRHIPSYFLYHPCNLMCFRHSLLSAFYSPTYPSLSYPFFLHYSTFFWHYFIFFPYQSSSILILFPPSCVISFLSHLSYIHPLPPVLFSVSFLPYQTTLSFLSNLSQVSFSMISPFPSSMILFSIPASFPPFLSLLLCCAIWPIFISTFLCFFLARLLSSFHLQCGCLMEVGCFYFSFVFY